MNKLKEILLELLSRYAQRKGIGTYIEDFSLRKGITLKNADIDLYGERVVAEDSHLKIGKKALFRKRICIDFTCKNFIIMPGRLSEKEFHLTKIEGNVIYDKPQRELSMTVILNETIALSLKVLKGCGESEFFIKADHLSINRYKQLFDGHILSRFMGIIHSDSPLTILCYYKYDRTSPYPKLNATFQYDSLKIVPDSCILSKDYLIGELNRRNHLAKDYQLFRQIPEIIRRTVLCTEDPSFELHKGISPVLIGMTLRANIEQKALKRGGSTISMQLIKNALLNGERTFSRKTEEAILTLLMENYYHVSKQDVLEVYLNMIEFAPDVYGIEEAARFYFGKPSSGLSIVEVLVLTYIIPRPIHFYEALLQKTEQLRKNLHAHIVQYLNVVVQKNIISPETVRSVEIKRIEFTERFGTLLLEP